MSRAPRPALAAVLFDLDDTLHDDTLAYRQAARRVADDVAAEHRIDAGDLLAAYVAQAESFWKNLSSASLGTPLVGVRATMWAAALASVGLENAGLAERCGVTYNEYRKGYLQLWPGALELLQSLRGAGCKLGLITNGFAETHREKIALLKLEDAFDEIFIADEVGMLKPDPRLFALACQRLGAAPVASAMVGDRYERDIRGAHALGLFTVWVNVRGERVPAGGPTPDATVKAIGEVEGVLPVARNG
ncbi:MAG: HAD family hydrolase [Vulcanimicrobiaceae bacterium]